MSGALLLSVRDLCVDFQTPSGPVRVLDGISFDVYRDEVLCIVGESGSGKSVTVLAIMGLLPPAARVTSGTIDWDGRDLLCLSPKQRRALRGGEMAMVFQDPMTSLNPVQRIGAQLGEMIGLHQPDLDRKSTRRLSAELLRAVRVPDPEGRLRAYPHQLSGGMRQRVMIAMAMANEPRLLFADEPTTALDVTTQAQVLDVLRKMRNSTGSAMVLITHDLGVVAETADRVLVVYSGRVAESGPVVEIFSDPHHPYTAGLLGSMLRVDSDNSEARAIRGQPPEPATRPPACAFQPRCELRQMAACSTETPIPRAVLSSGAYPQDGTPPHLTACYCQGDVAAWIAAGRPARDRSDIPESYATTSPTSTPETAR